MTSKDFYKILDILGMINPEEDSYTEDKFINEISIDVVNTISFVDYLFIHNDQNYIKNLLVALILKLNKKEK